MSRAIQKSTYPVRTERLPVWLRCALISLATIVFWSCIGVIVPNAMGEERTTLKADKSLNDPPKQSPAEGATVVIQDSPVQDSAVELQGDTSLSCGPCSSGDSCAITLDPYGPMPGPSDEYLCDGGDFVTPAGVTKDRKIVGLQPEDAISHYDTADGRVLVTPSNRVCIYAPRFAAVRRVVQVVAHEQPVFVDSTMEEQSPAKARLAVPPISGKQRKTLAIDMGQRPPNLFRQRQQAGGLENLQAAMEAYGSLMPYANLSIIRTGEASAAEKPVLERSMQHAVTLTGVQAAQVLFGVQQAHAEIGLRQPGVIYSTTGPKSPQLRLLKLASCGQALPGEEIEFTLRYDNIGDQVIGNVTIADNLSTRFEYIAGTAKSSVNADFITQQNEVGSLVLRWEIKEPVKPSAGGILRFKVKVR